MMLLCNNLSKTFDFCVIDRSHISLIEAFRAKGLAIVT